MKPLIKGISNNAILLITIGIVAGLWYLNVIPHTGIYDNTCYQESATIKNQNGTDTIGCGLNYSGFYVLEGYVINWTNINDGDWNNHFTGYVTASTVNGFDIRYVKPLAEVSGARWKVGFVDDNGLTTATEIPVPDVCFKYNPVVMRVLSYSYVNTTSGNNITLSTPYCYNGTAFIGLSSNGNGRANIADEAMIWILAPNASLDTFPKISMMSSAEYAAANKAIVVTVKNDGLNGTVYVNAACSRYMLTPGTFLLRSVLPNTTKQVTYTIANDTPAGTYQCTFTAANSQNVVTDTKPMTITINPPVVGQNTTIPLAQPNETHPQENVTVTPINVQENVTVTPVSIQTQLSSLTSDQKMLMIIGVALIIGALVYFKKGKAII